MARETDSTAVRHWIDSCAGVLMAALQRKPSSSRKESSDCKPPFICRRSILLGLQSQRRLKGIQINCWTRRIETCSQPEDCAPSEEVRPEGQSPNPLAAALRLPESKVMWFDMKVSGGRPRVAKAADYERAGGGTRREGAVLGLLVSSITIQRQSSAPFPAFASRAAPRKPGRRGSKITNN